MWTLVRGATRGVVRWIRVSAGSQDPRRLRRRMQPVDDWDARVDGRARRLTERETIRVTRLGRFDAKQPLHTAEGWRDPVRVGAVGVWSLAVGATALYGWLRGRGPLGTLRDVFGDDTRSDVDGDDPGFVDGS